MIDDNFSLAGKDIAHAQSVAAAVVREVENERILRGIKFRKNWDMYNGKHEIYFRQRLDEDDAIFKYRKDNPTVVNFTGFTVDLAARYLYGRGNKVYRKYSKNDATNLAMIGLVADTDIDNFLLDASKKAAVFGEVTARLIPVDKETGLQPKYNKSTPTTQPQPILLDPMNTWVKRNRWNKIVAVVMSYRSVDFTTNTAIGVTELVVDDTRVLWSNDSSADAFASMAVSYAGTPMLAASNGVMVANYYDLCDEFVHMVNNQDRLSDIEGIMDLNVALDEAMTDKKHFFAKHGWPQLVSEVDLSKVQHSPNKIWEISPDVDDGKDIMKRLGFLVWDGKMADHEKFVKNLERQIMIISNTAAISTGDLEAIGQLRSGAALITAHSVAIHKTQAKQIIWDKNEKNLFKAMANFDSYLKNTKVESRYRDLDIEIKFPKDFVPGAEHERAQINQIMFNSHLVPLREILRTEYPNATPDDIESMYKEIMADSEDIVDSTREFVSKTDTVAGPTGKSGTPMQKSSQQSQ